MKTCTVGKSGMEVSRIAQGTWSMGGDAHWGSRDEEQCVRCIRSSVEQGITLIDTAPVYGFGSGEQIVGKAIQGVPRDQVIVLTKCGLTWTDDEGPVHMVRDGRTLRRNLSRQAILKHIDESLQNLGTDYIDIYMTHEQAVPPMQTPIEETMDALKELKRAGKIRAIGVSNCSPEQLKTYLACGEIAVVEESFSMLNQKKAQAIGELCEKENIGFLAYSPLEQGLLSGMLGMDYVVPEGHVRSRNQWFVPYWREQVLHMLAGWKTLTDKYESSMTTLVTAWNLAYHRQMVVLAGTKSPEHMADYVAGSNITLAQADYERMCQDLQSLLDKKKMEESGT